MEQNKKAFPESCTQEGHRPNVDNGMDLRDYFAAKYMNGRISNGIRAGHFESMAESAYRMADIMIKERNKN